MMLYVVVLLASFRLTVCELWFSNFNAKTSISYSFDLFLTSWPLAISSGRCKCTSTIRKSKSQPVNLIERSEARKDPEKPARGPTPLYIYDFSWARRPPRLPPSLSLCTFFCFYLPVLENSVSDYFNPFLYDVLDHFSHCIAPESNPSFKKRPMGVLCSSIGSIFATQASQRYICSVCAL